MVRVALILSILCAGTVSVSAQTSEEVCEAFVQFAAKQNQATPRLVDEITELVELRVFCETTTFLYVKRLLVAPKDLGPGWTKHRRRAHLQLNCNDAGLASVWRWTVKTTLLDRKFNDLVTLVTSPEDCS